MARTSGCGRNGGLYRERRKIMDKPALLEMRGICKEFPGVKALDNVDLTVRPGTVHA